MTSDVLLAAIRIEYTDAQVSEAHAAIFTAFRNRLDKVTIIVGKGNESSSASGQVVVNAADYEMWLAALQQRLREIAASSDATGTLHEGTEHVSFSRRFIRT